MAEEPGSCGGEGSFVRFQQRRGREKHLSASAPLANLVLGAQRARGLSPSAQQGAAARPREPRARSPGAPPRSGARSVRGAVAAAAARTNRARLTQGEDGGRRGIRTMSQSVAGAGAGMGEELADFGGAGRTQSLGEATEPRGPAGGGGWMRPWGATAPGGDGAPRAPSAHCAVTRCCPRLTAPPSG
ncbi:translation initiation factor IF-2-like [Rousettus aegyptiacus]|uniref:translation initiation factor IF-2-like n=1 Tax=Rousettus aegyptiacus TaxID=9407 RepID=UPI00168D04E1|nr:translation initiation factor IF-2-like [Rousettus aegyptiacus]